MKCEECYFDLPDDWPLTPVEYPAAQDPESDPATATVPPSIVIKCTLCAPCARRATPAPVQDRPGPTMTDYHALPPHVPAGRRKETKR